MLLAKRKLKLETERLTLRPPVHSDFRDWSAMREDSRKYQYTVSELTVWERQPEKIQQADEQNPES